MPEGTQGELTRNPLDLEQLDFPLEPPCECSDHDRLQIPVQAAEFIVVFACSCKPAMAFCSPCLQRKLAHAWLLCPLCSKVSQPASRAYKRIEPIR